MVLRVCITAFPNSLKKLVHPQVCQDTFQEYSYVVRFRAQTLLGLNMREVVPSKILRFALLNSFWQRSIPVFLFQKTQYNHRHCDTEIE